MNGCCVFKDSYALSPSFFRGCVVLLAIQTSLLIKSQDYSEMAKTRRAKRGGGYGTSQQFFNPSVLPPAAGMFSSDVSTAATSTMIRPMLPATFKGGRRTRRALKGGFSPSIMGGFIPNAQAAIVPAALYLVYHTMVPKSSSKSAKRATRRRR